MAVFWGLETGRNNSSKCHALRLETDESNHLKVSVVEFVFAEDTSVWIRQTTRVSFEKVRIDKASEMDVTIAIRDGKIEKLKIQKQDVEIDSLDIRKPLLHKGKLGIVCVDGKYVVTDAWLTNLEK